MKITIAIIITLFFSYTAFALGTVSKIEVSGNSRTSSKVILRELTFHEGEGFDDAKIERSKQNLLNMRIFSNVEISTHSINEEITLKVDVVEKWTTIPIVSFGGGGGSSFLHLGVYDPNVFGEYIELGARYSRLNSSNSFVAWYRDPRLLQNRYSLLADVWWQNQALQVYDKETLVTAYGLKRLRVNLIAETKLVDGLSLSLGIDTTKDTYSSEILNKVEVTKQHAQEIATIADGRTIFVKAAVKLGEIHYFQESASGFQSEINFESASKNFGSDFNVQRLQLQTLISYPVTKMLQYAGRVHVLAGNAFYQHHLYRMGGLEQLRGFKDNQVTGPNGWFSNQEMRYISYRRPSLVLQNVLFIDAGNLQHSLSQSFIKPYSSIGTGIRIIFPNIYNVALRLDFAKAVTPYSTWGISFGVRQFYL